MFRQPQGPKRDGRIFLVLVLLGALLALPGFSVGCAAGPAPTCQMVLAAELPAHPCPGCCPGGTMACCALTEHGELPGALPSAGAAPARTLDFNFDLPRQLVGLMPAPWSSPGGDALPRLPATVAPSPRSPAQQRALGCLWLI